MYYEIYIDRVFFLSFCMNFYMLFLVNKLLHMSASKKRTFIGALLGSMGAVVPLFLPIHIAVRFAVSFVCSVITMSVYTFRVRGFHHLGIVVEKMFIVTLLMGGILLFVLKTFFKGTNSEMNIVKVLGLGGVSCGIVFCMIIGKWRQPNLCKVRVPTDHGMVEMEAFIDTGNTLREPISQRPVIVAQVGVLNMLYGDKIPELFRMIPYHSVGKAHGLLKGYLLPEIEVEVHGGRKKCKQIYIATCEEVISLNGTCTMILNPGIIEE